MLDMSDARNATEFGDVDLYRNSRTVTEITESLIDRYMAGSRKYGEFIDDAKPPTHITGETSFAEMAYNELLDGVTYALKAKEAHEAQQQELVAKDDLLARAKDTLLRQHEIIAELTEAVEKAEANAEMLQFENEQLKADLEEARKDDASSVHRILELEQELSLQSTRADSYRNRLAKAQTAYNRAKHAYEVRDAQVKKVPKFLRGLIA